MVPLRGVMCLCLRLFLILWVVETVYNYISVAFFCMFICFKILLMSPVTNFQRFQKSNLLVKKCFKIIQLFSPIVILDRVIDYLDLLS